MRNHLLHSAVIVLVLATQSLFAFSQQANSKSDPPVTSTVEAPRHYYKLTFLLRETDEGRILNQRVFNASAQATPARSADRVMIRAGSRLPVHDAKGSDWIEIGVSLDVSNIVETDNGLQMEVRTDISSLAAEDGSFTPGNSPVIRQVRTSSALVAPIGKASQVFTADDPASKHRFELEVTPSHER